MHTTSAPPPALGGAALDSVRYSALIRDATVTGISRSRPLSWQLLPTENGPQFPRLAFEGRYGRRLFGRRQPLQVLLRRHLGAHQILAALLGDRRLAARRRGEQRE